MTWKTLSKKTLIKNDLFTLTVERCRKHNGKIAKEYFSLKKPESVIIIPFTKDKKVVLIKQYRHPIRTTKHEVPAGYIEKKDKTFIASAKRELQEETGYKARKFIRVGKAFALSGFMTNAAHFYVALDCKKISGQHLDENEEISVHLTTWKNTLKMLKKSDIMDMGSIAGILLAKEYLDNHKII